MNFNELIGEMMNEIEDMEDLESIENMEEINVPHEEEIGEEYIKEHICSDGKTKIVIEKEDDKFEVEVYQIAEAEYVDTMEEAEELFTKMIEKYDSNFSKDNDEEEDKNEEE